MKYYRQLALSALMLAPTSTIAADQMTIAVVGKTKNDSFYQQSFAGCELFASKQQDLKCLYDGPDDFQDVRGQASILRGIAEKGIDGILLSTTDSTYLVEWALTLAKEKNIPVITFDSDLLPEHHDYRLAYVGTNNFDFGAALGNYAKKFKGDEKREICIQSGHKTTPNLNARIAGVRYALSGERDNQKLTGQNGWYESNRCPLYTMGKRKTALVQLEFVLSQDKPPIYLAVAGFAQFSPDYIDTIAPFKPLINNDELVVISADTEAVQLAALKEGLSTINIGQRPFEMGRKGAELLYDFIKRGNKPAQQLYYLDFHYCRPDNVDQCTISGDS